MRRVAVTVTVLLLAPILLLWLLPGGRQDRALVSEHLATLSSGCTIWVLTLMLLWITSG